MSGTIAADLLQAALALHAKGELGRAKELYRQYLERAPKDATARFALGVACLDAGGPAEAAAQLDVCLALDPKNADAALALGRARLELSEPEAALRAFAAASRLRPDDPDARCGQGAALTMLGRAKEALAAHQDALTLTPGHPDALAGLGGALLGLGRAEEALGYLHQALAVRPDDPDAHNTLGAVLKSLGRLDEAVEAFEVALEARPVFPEALANLGSSLRETGLPDEARAAYDRATRLAPSPALALRRALTLPPVLSSPGQIARLRTELAAEIARIAGSAPRIADPYAEVGETAFYLAYHGLDDLSLQQALAGLHLAACPELAFTAPHCRHGQTGQRGRKNAGKIRIGFVSAFLHNHTIGKLFGGFISRLDRRRFEVAVLRLPGHDDATGARFMAEADLSGFVPDNLAGARQKIADAACDALFYPDIGMHALGYFLAFARLAPVQFATWGHPVTTGIPNVDYFLTSETLSPRDGPEGFGKTPSKRDGPEGFSERLVRFSRLPICYARPAPPSRSYSRADFGLPPDKRVYLCPQSLFKFHPDFDAAIGTILNEDPRAVFATIAGKHPRWEEILRARFAIAFDHDPGRILFLPRQSMDGFAGLLAQADCLLDTFHFGGGNTTIEALAQNLPVVTLPTQFLRGRISLACYRQMGIPGPVADNSRHFADLAIRLANDPDYRTSQQHAIAQTKDALFDDNEAVREFEEFVETAVTG